MELKLTLSVKEGSLLPINYQYELSAWIYNVIGRAAPEYSTFLHEKGFKVAWRSFKMFTFSQLDARPYSIQEGAFKLLGKEVRLIVRFAADACLEHFVRGLFMHQHVGLGDRYHVVDFEVTGVEPAPLPIFQPTMRYTCLSPICISRLREDRTTAYLVPTMADYGRLLVQNLVRKSHALVDVNEAVTQDMPRFEFRLLNTPRKKGVHIKAHTSRHTQVIGYLFRFELTIPVELHELGYDAGFGEKNSMGFGCVAI